MALIKIDPKKPTQISQNFKSGEFTCNCGQCKESFIDSDLLARLESVRFQYGHGLIITSGYRCSMYQGQLRKRGYETAVGTSQHELGMAVDIRPAAQGDFAALLPILERNFQAIGVGKTFYHVDMRSDKQRRWTYAKR